MDSECSTPKSTEEVLSPKLETVSATPNKGETCCAAPTVDGGECGTGHWEGDGVSVKFVRSAGPDGHGPERPGMSDRSFSIKPAKAPNKKKK